jgi:hypothetical protein
LRGNLIHIAGGLDTAAGIWRRVYLNIPPAMQKANATGHLLLIGTACLAGKVGWRGRFDCAVTIVVGVKPCLF